MQGRDFFYNAPCRCRKVDPVILLMVQTSANQVSPGKSHLQGFIHPRWLFGISAINSIGGAIGWSPGMMDVNDGRLLEAFRILQKSQGRQDVSHKKPLAFLDINDRHVGKPSFTLYLVMFIWIIEGNDERIHQFFPS